MSVRSRHDASRAYRSPSGLRRVLAVSIQSVVVTGTVYPSYAGAQAVTASATQNTTVIPSSATLGFSNVPVGNNEWVVADVVGFDSPNGSGSHIDLGQLAGFVNVGTSNTSASIDANSTVRLQVGLSAMLQGIVSTYDLKNETTLDADLGSAISGVSPSPSTGLFTTSQLASFMSSLYQTYNRTLTVSGGAPGPSLATIAYNSTDAAENAFAYNAVQTNAVNGAFAQQGSAQPGSGNVGLATVGNPFSALLAQNLHTPTSPSGTTPLQVHAEAISAPNGTVQIQHVYGGSIYAGIRGVSAAAIAAGSFSGGLSAVAGRAQGDSSTISVPVASTQTTMTMNDPQAAAFSAAPYYGLTPNTGNSYVLDCNYATSAECSLGSSTVTAVSGSAATVAFDTFNPWGLTTTQLQVCTGLDCFPLSSGSANSVRYPFYDRGNSLSYYGWSPVPGSGVSAVTQPITGGYALALSGTSGAIQSTTPAYFYPHQDVQLVSDAPAGTTWTATLTCPGQVLQNSGIQQLNGAADIYMMNLGPNSAQCTQIQFAFVLPPPGESGSPSTITISSIGVPPLGTP